MLFRSGAHYGAERLGCTVIPMSGGQTEKQVQLITDFKPDIIMVTPSYMQVLIEEFRRQGLDARESSLKIGMVGSGRVGSALGELWLKAGHEVMFSSLNLEADRALAAKLGGKARAGSSKEAAAFGDVVFLAVPYGALPQLGKDLAEGYRGKVVLDACNPFANRDGEIGRAHV